MSLSEFDIIDRFFTSEQLTRGQFVRLGPGDDCAIIKPGEDQEICVSTDTLISGVHFPDSSSAEVIAHRSLAANLSDLAAMGAEPLGFTLALTLPGVDEIWLERFSAYLTQMVQTYRCPLIGGNLSRGNLSLTLQVMGVLPMGKALKRSGAMTGDDLYVSGFLGDAAAGLMMLTSQPEGSDYLIRRYQYPQPRLDLGIQLRDMANSAIDISDGLISDASHIAQRSKKGVKIDLPKIPLSRELIDKVGKEAALKMALSGGDDYELCFSAPVHHRQSLEDGFGVTRIGEITEQGGEENDVVFTDSSGRQVDVNLRGYNHFDIQNDLRKAE